MGPGHYLRKVTVACHLAVEFTLRVLTSGAEKDFAFEHSHVPGGKDMHIGRTGSSAAPLVRAKIDQRHNVFNITEENDFDNRVYIDSCSTVHVDIKRSNMFSLKRIFHAFKTASGSTSSNTTGNNILNLYVPLKKRCFKYSFQV